MLKINLENNVLTIESPNREKVRVLQRPDIGALGDERIRIITYFGGTMIEPFTAHYSEIEINGSIYPNIDATLEKLAEIIAVFKHGGGDGSGVSLTDVNNAIGTHNTDETAHTYIQDRIDALTPKLVLKTETTDTLAPVPMVYYDYINALTLLTLNITASLLPSIIWFKVGSSLPTLIFNGNDLIVTNFDFDYNKDYEMSIINNRISIQEFNRL